MKYLKKFFESKAVSSEDIREFCEGYLYYLYDEGFQMDISKITENIFRMELKKID